MAVALALDDPPAALLLLTAATFVAVAPAEGGVQARATTVTAVLALLAVAVGYTVVTPGNAAFNLPDVVASAVLIGAAAVGVRTGAIPIGEPARSLAALPAHVAAGAGRAWLPAAALLTLASVIAGVLAPTRSELDTTADAIRIGSVLALALVGALTIFVRDVRTLVGATVVVNAGLVLFALVPAVLRAPELGPRAVATWLPLFGVLATWAVAWLVALHATEPDLRIQSTRGWARRRPLLAVALVAGGALSYGLPGTWTWDTRAALLDLGLGTGQLRDAAGVLAWLPAFGLVRLLLAGLRHSTDAASQIDGAPQGSGRLDRLADGGRAARPRPGARSGAPGHRPGRPAGHRHHVSPAPLLPPPRAARSLRRREHPAVDVAAVAEEFVRAEPERQLLRRVLSAVRRVD